MSNIHDETFKKLMQHKPFLLAFFKYYLPKKVYGSINWDTCKIFKISGEHIREIFPIDLKQFNLAKDIGDLSYIVQKKNKQKALIYLHTEHQSTPDRFIFLRTGLYLLGTLYEYAKMHPKSQLPEVYSVIYYHGAKPYPHVKSLWQMFPKNYQAKDFLFDPNFVDLSTVDDRILLKHTPIALAEIAFKHIFDKRYQGMIQHIVSTFKQSDGEIKSDVLRYLINSIDAKEDFLTKLSKALPEEEVMTLGERLEQKGFVKGMAQGKLEGLQSGIEQGKHEEALEIAKNMFLKGLDLNLIKEITSLSDQDLAQIMKSH